MPKPKPVQNSGRKHRNRARAGWLRKVTTDAPAVRCIDVYVGLVRSGNCQFSTAASRCIARRRRGARAAKTAAIVAAFANISRAGNSPQSGRNRPREQPPRLLPTWRNPRFPRRSGCQRPSLFMRPDSAGCQKIEGIRGVEARESRRRFRDRRMAIIRIEFFGGLVQALSRPGTAAARAEPADDPNLVSHGRADRQDSVNRSA
jgi:hypothetical protein